MAMPSYARRLHRLRPLFLRLGMLSTLGSLAMAGCSSSASGGKCTPQDACHLAGTWLDDVGACTNPPAPDGTVCDDGTACTSGDACTQGYCMGTAIFCSTTDSCGYPNACDPNSGCPSTSTATCSTPPLAAPVSGCSSSDYYTDVVIGGQTFAMIIDSGSTTLAVAGSDCAHCGVSPEYAPGVTAMDQNATADAVYGDNSKWDGEIYQDSVSVAGAPVVALDFAVIEDQEEFFSANNCGTVAQSNTFQGILGMGPRDLAAAGTEPYMYQLADKSGYPNVFGVALTTNGGNLWIGGYDPAAVNGNMQFTPMVDSIYYSVAFNDFLINGKSVGLTPEDFGPVVVDTGTSEFMLPDDIYTQVTNLLLADATFQSNFGTQFFAGGDGIAAATNATSDELDSTLPKITLSFPVTNSTANISLTLPPTRSYLVPVPGNGNTVLYANGLYQSSQTLLGNSFMRALVVVFAGAAQQVGFALAND